MGLKEAVYKICKLIFITKQNLFSEYINEILVFFTNNITLPHLQNEKPSYIAKKLYTLTVYSWLLATELNCYYSLIRQNK